MKTLKAAPEATGRDGDRRVAHREGLERASASPEGCKQVGRDAPLSGAAPLGCVSFLAPWPTGGIHVQ